ncbi:Universal stress protein A family protein C25B2.10 [Trametes pubescens]|uniref:Universal stress protein A family protein C25B2.10 n=1 Tax=Trametes pubescens TaxID=154538 RepID=A0A1M2VE75_TRAPU|nr:Universal stress protein A family protein C25B2.10 [Trametes pubescens]
MTSPEERPHYIPLPPPLRSAMKHSSRPSTPNSIPSSSPNLPASSLSPPLTGIPLGSPALSASTLPTFAASTPAFHTPYSQGIPASSNASSTAVTMGSPNTPASPLIAAQGYTPKVSFDTLENPQASMFSYTLHVQSEGYARMRSTRVFLCASSPDESGRQALDWCLESLVQDGDELVVFRGVDPDDFGTLSVPSASVDSVLIPIVADNDHDQYREDARGLMHQIQEKCVEYDAERKLSIIVEYIAGKVTQTLDRLIALYRPDSVVVGTRGQRSVMQAWAGAFGAPGVGSVSKYCLSHSPVPVIVVRPESKVKKTMAKRRANPKRGQHFDELTKPKTNNGSLSVPMFSTLTR